MFEYLRMNNQREKNVINNKKLRKKKEKKNKKRKKLNDYDDDDAITDSKYLNTLKLSEKLKVLRLIFQQRKSISLLSDEVVDGKIPENVSIPERLLQLSKVTLYNKETLICAYKFIVKHGNWKKNVKSIMQNNFGIDFNLKNPTNEMMNFFKTNQQQQQQYPHQQQQQQYPHQQQQQQYPQQQQQQHYQQQKHYQRPQQHHYYYQQPSTSREGLPVYQGQRHYAPPPNSYRQQNPNSWNSIWNNDYNQPPMQPRFTRGRGRPFYPNYRGNNVRGGYHGQPRAPFDDGGREEPVQVQVQDQEDEETLKMIAEKKKKIEEEIERSKKQIEKQLKVKERVKKLKSKLAENPLASNQLQEQQQQQLERAEQEARSVPLIAASSRDLILSADELRSVGSGQAQSETNVTERMNDPTDVSTYAKVCEAAGGVHAKVSQQRIANTPNWDLNRKRNAEETDDCDGEIVAPKRKKKKKPKQSDDDELNKNKNDEELRTQWGKVEERLKKMLLSKDKAFLHDLINAPLISTRRILMQKLLDEHRANISKELAHLRFDGFSRNNEEEDKNSQLRSLEDQEEAVIDLSDLSDLPSQIYCNVENFIKSHRNNRSDGDSREVSPEDVKPNVRIETFTSNRQIEVTTETVNKDEGVSNSGCLPEAQSKRNKKHNATSQDLPPENAEPKIRIKTFAKKSKNHINLYQFEESAFYCDH